MPPTTNPAEVGSVARRVLRYGERQACTRADGVISVSQWYADQLAPASYGRTPLVIPNGPRTERVGEQPPRHGYAFTQSWPTLNPHALSVGRLIPDKRFEDLVGAAPARLDAICES